MSDATFEQHVTDSLARLETSMESLIGPEGRINKIETTLFRVVIGTIILAVLVLGPVAVISALK